MAMVDVMATLGCVVVLPLCEQPRDHVPSDTHLRRLLVSAFDIQVQVESHLSVCLQQLPQVTTHRQLQASGMEYPIVVSHREVPWP